MSTFNYDLLGRMTGRTEPAGSSSFTFGNSAAAKNIGQLASLSGFGYSENLTYDTYGRLSRKRIVSDANYDFDFTYNSDGSLHNLEYPSSTSGYRLKLEYEYANGQLKRIKDAQMSATVLWELNAVDAAGSALDVTLGANIKVISGFDPLTGQIDYRQSGLGGGTAIQNLEYDWNAIGNLTQRKDLNQSGLTEQFSYDVLGRFTSSTRNGNGNLQTAYDEIGNITSKTSSTQPSENVGLFNYTSAQSGCTYYSHSQRHAVRKAGNIVYCYDANGNMTKRKGSNISWYSYNLPNTINQPGGNYSQFFYGPDRNRWKQIANHSGVTETTIYVGGLLEKVTKSGVTTWKHYVQAPTGIATLYLRRTGGTPLEETYYLTQDHLGTTDKVINAAGVIVSVAESFGAFGQRRGSSWTGLPTAPNWAAIGASTRDGFTGHEHLDNLTLIHMNGRVYDPFIGRFVSADPFIQFPYDGQSQNRFSYLRNNPLSGVDPSGYNERTTPVHPSCRTADGADRRCQDAFDRLDAVSARLDGAFAISSWDRDPCYMESNAYLCATGGRTVIVPASSNVPVSVASNGTQVANTIWPGYQLGTCLSHGMNSAIFNSPDSCTVGDWGWGILGVVPYVGSLRAARSISVVWRMTPFARGISIEVALGRNLPGNFPVIDRFVDGIATSIKSIDLSAKSYQNASVLARTLRRYIDKVAEFKGYTWGGVTVPGAAITGRALELAIPATGMSPAQMATLLIAIQYAERFGVKLSIILL